MKRLAMPLVIAIVFLITVVPSWLGVYSGYYQFVLMLIGINITLTVSLNLINGYMGEFSVGHAAFMGAGAYVASIINVYLLADSNFFGQARIAPGWSILIFPISLILGGIAASLFSLLVAFPSFRTRGDYLAIITLAVNFIFKSVIENIDKIGGPRGFMGMGGVVKAMQDVINIPWVMIWVFIVMVFSIYIVRNLVSSIMGKGIVAIRDDEIAAELMTVNTRRMKVIAFMLACGLAGMAGGLHAHAVSFINPSSYFIIQSTFMLVMVYLGGMGSLSGSVISAVLFTILLELMKPLGLYRFVVIPVLFILLMLLRPSGLMGNRELSDIFPPLRKFFGTAEERISHVPASD
ncbi:MAG TPA: branched-chain amino acid ABC transporter permease [Anaerolineales bacterium]|jgi:branched-chain amino acid transport system permease protein